MFGSQNMMELAYGEDSANNQLEDTGYPLIIS